MRIVTQAEKRNGLFSILKAGEVYIDIIEHCIVGFWGMKEIDWHECTLLDSVHNVARIPFKLFNKLVVSIDQWY